MLLLSFEPILFRLIQIIAATHPISKSAPTIPPTIPAIMVVFGFDLEPPLSALGVGGPDGDAEGPLYTLPSVIPGFPERLNIRFSFLLSTEYKMLHIKIVF